MKERACGLRGPFLITLLIVMSNPFVLAQVTASISGRIEDPSGAAIPAAAVTVTSLETGAARTVTADGAGNYRVLSLPVSEYEVRVEKAGFKTVVQKGIHLVVGQAAVVNLSLEVGTVQQEVTVTAEAPVVNTTTASVSGLVGEKQVKELPLNGRSFDNLITLNTGAINFTQFKSSGNIMATSGAEFSVAGRRPGENLFLLNGVEYTGPAQTVSLPGGVSGQMLGIDAVREFNVVSEAYSAEYGKRSGAQISIVTQSGTNQLHGSAFEFLRNSALDARDFFDRLSDQRIPPFKRNQFGGSLGGPIQKDKTFIFGNYEGFRQRLGLSSVSIVPDKNARQGLLPNAQGVPTPVANLNPAILPYFALWPEPNGPSLGGGVALAFTNPKQSIREDFGTVRLDRTFSNKDSFSANYLIDDGFNVTPLADPVFAITPTMRNQVLSLQETHIFSPNLLNVFTAGFSRVLFFFDQHPIVPVPASLSFVTGRPAGNIGIGGAIGGVTGLASITTAGGGSASSRLNAKNLFTYTDSLQVIRGSHQISAGVSFVRLQSNESGAFIMFGQANFPSLTAMLQGLVAPFQVTPNITAKTWRQWEGAWYLQDAIRLRSNLSLRVGLRHEFTNGWNDPTGRSANFVFDSNGIMLTKPLVGTSPFTENNAKWLLGPRVGLAWDPFGNGKTSVRAGAGIHYFVQDNYSYLLGPNPPFNGILAFAGVPLSSLVPVAPNTPAPPTCGPGVPQPCATFAPNGVQSSVKTPSIGEWNLAIERQLTLNTNLRVAYVGSHGWHQIVVVDMNSIHPQICSSASGCVSGGIGAARGLVPQGAQYIPVGTRPNPYLAGGNFWFSEGNADYHALQVDVTKRFSQGFQFRANYTWAKNLDTLGGAGISEATNEAQMVLNPYDMRSNWGPSSQDFRHQVSISGSYELPLGQGKPWLKGASGAGSKLASGWQVNWIVSLLSGFPFTPLVGSNQSGNGDGRIPDRPSANPAFSGPVILGTPDKWFNPNAYVLPVPGTWGNVGRGVLRGPALRSFDLSLFKNTTLTERMRLQFRSEFFNVLNHPNLGLPNAVVFAGGAISPSAGLITRTATTSRQIQFGLKLIF